MDAVFIIGGANTGNIVAEFNNDVWRRLPDLRHPRSRHGSIIIGSLGFIFGGITVKPELTIETEVWDFEAGESMTTEPTLSQEKYSEGFALYFIDNPEFCLQEIDQTLGVPVLPSGMNPYPHPNERR